MKSTAVFAKKKSREEMVFYNHHHLLIYSRALDPPEKKSMVGVFYKTASSVRPELQWATYAARSRKRCISIHHQYMVGWLVGFKRASTVKKMSLKYQVKLEKQKIHIYRGVLFVERGTYKERETKAAIVWTNHSQTCKRGFISLMMDWMA